MLCPNQESLAMLIDRELEVSETEAIRRHLAGCRSCREFVEELRRVDACGRAAVQAIPAPKYVPSISVSKTRPEPWALPNFRFALAAVFIALAVGAWFGTERLSRSPSPPPPETVAESPSAAEGKSTDIPTAEHSNTARTSEEAFARWVEPYQRLQIQLVPMETAANYRPPQILPAYPESWQ